MSIQNIMIDPSDDYITEDDYLYKVVDTKTLFTMMKADDREFKFYKLTNKEENHHGFQYVTGLNVDNIPFNPTRECQPGGLYFFAKDQLIYFNMYANSAYYIREITLLDDSRIYIENHKFKTDKFVLGERTKFELPMEMHMPAVIANMYTIIHINKLYAEKSLCKTLTDQDREHFDKTNLYTVSMCGIMLKFVYNKTKEICEAAIYQNPEASIYVDYDMKYI